MLWVYQKTDLKKILKGVSRSFYLSLILLPKRVRLQMGLAFLYAKYADTQTDVVELSEAEHLLMKAKPALDDALAHLSFEDRLLIEEVVAQVKKGMEMDKKIRAFETIDELEQYIYYVAGCVGIFWTKMIQRHFGFGKNFNEETFESAMKLGKGLQLVNILRDLPYDLKQNRSYIPPGISLPELVQKAKNYLSAYPLYLSYYPWHAFRLKMTVRLPARLGFQTLDLLANSQEWLNPTKTHKVSRRQVYQTLLKSFLK